MKIKKYERISNTRKNGFMFSPLKWTYTSRMTRKLEHEFAISLNNGNVYHQDIFFNFLDEETV